MTGTPTEVLEAAYRALIAASIEYERAEFVRLHTASTAKEQP
ncbi:hypothetical protein [Serpentinimonas barnesii]|nr:hypothetical protein [Serpentinimonas barnesii]